MECERLLTYFYKKTLKQELLFNLVFKKYFNKNYAGTKKLS